MPAKQEAAAIEGKVMPARQEATAIEDKVLPARRKELRKRQQAAER